MNKIARERKNPPAVAAVVAAGLALPGTACAHSFGKLFNLPVPLWMYVYGATVALALSFLIVAWFVTAPAPRPQPRGISLDDSGLMRALRRLRLLPVLRAFSLLALGLCVLTGLFGARNAYTNINMTLFWIVFCLGYAYLTALIGDLYAAINPWRSLAYGLELLFPGYGRGRRPYPRRLGYWPALLLYMAYIWLELFGFTRPFSLAVILLAYTAINLLAVWWVGEDAWFRHGEFFGVFLRLLAKMAPLDYRPGADGGRGHLRVRWPFAGVLETRAENYSELWFVLFMLSSTAFDGLHDTVPWIRWFWIDFYGWLKPWVGDNPLMVYPKLIPWFQAWQTLCLLASPFIYGAAYLLFIRLARAVTRSTLTVRELALRFAYTLLPIALVYNITHYYTLILSQGSKIVSLVSDPFGYGWNLFGTLYWLRAPIIPNAATVWDTQLLLIVSGHIVSVYLAHVEALRVFPTRRQATLSQLPMLLLMVLFTTAGLWILSEPIR
ncbi:MAG: hypothetical protein ACRETW_01095 [Stenotrophobium sp.]